MKRPSEPQPLSLLEATLPVASLILLVGLSYFLFGDRGAVGPNQTVQVPSGLAFSSGLLLSTPALRWSVSSRPRCCPE